LASDIKIYTIDQYMFYCVDLTAARTR